MEKKKVLITGNSFSWNFGSMALVVSSLQTLKTLNKNILFYKGSIEKNKDLKRYSKYFSRKELVVFGFNKKKLPMSLSAILLLFWSIPYYLKCNLVIENPGETTKDTWLMSQFARFIIAKILHKKFIVYGISAGPFKYNITKTLARFMYRNSYKVFIREEVSKQYLEKIGVKNTELTADHAFLLNLPSKKRRLELDQKYIRCCYPFIGISVKHSYVKYVNYKKSILKFINYICNKQEKNVLLIPHGEEDKKLTSDIYKIINNKHTNIIRESLLPDELKYIISKADIFIGSRVHACIASWSSFVPTILFVPQIDHRSIGFSKMLNLEEYIIDPSKDDGTDLINGYIKLHKNRNKVRARLQRKFIDIKNLCLKNAEFIVNELF